MMDLPNQVLGFFFNQERSRVLLILKNRPDHLKGMYNGVGGKCEHREKYIDAIVREFKEETNLYISHERWKNFCSMNVSVKDNKATYYVECF